jgi:cytoskeletal protein CcmA (bactofilin family)
MSHFDEMTGLLYLEGQLDADRAHTVAAHADSCPECRALLHALKSEDAWLREALAAEDEVIPARLVDAPVRAPVPWGWVTAFGLGAGGAYTLWSGFVEPLRTEAAQAGFTQGNLLTMLFFSGAFWKGWDAMRSLMEFLAMATLGTVMVWLLRRHWRRFATVAVVMGTMLCALAMPSTVGAAEVKKGNPGYTLPAGEEVKTDLIVTAERTQIDGVVDGDLIVFSSNVTVNGHVKGDILSFTQELRVNGTVDGNIRDFSQKLQLNGTVGKNVMVWAEHFNLEDEAKVGGTITMGSSHAQLSGQLAGDLLAFAGDLDINGSLGHDASIMASQLTIGPKAEIKGQTKFQGHHQPDVSSTAKLGSPIEVTIEKHRAEAAYNPARVIWHQLLHWGASFLFGLVFLLLAPGFFADASNSCKKVAPAIGFGILFLFATPIAAIIACCTIVGLGVGISALFLYLIAIYATQVFVGAWLGERLLGTSAGVGLAIGKLALGLAILRALRMIPFVGGWICFLIILWGLGALALAVYKNMRPPVAAAA